MGKVVSAVLEIGAAIAVLAIPGVGEALEIGLASIGIAGAAVSTAIAGIALSVGLSAAESLFTKTPSLSNSLYSRLSLNIDTVAPRKIVFGNTAAGCDLRFKEVYGSNSDRIALSIALASHRVNAIQKIYLDNELSWAGQGQGPSGKYADGIELFWEVEQGSHSNAHPLGTGSYWNNTAYFTGCAYSQVVYKADKTKVWTDGLPSTIVHVVEGCPVYDPRLDSTNGGSGPHRPYDQTTWDYISGSTAIGRNPALCLLTFLLGWQIEGKLAWGMGIPASRINLESFILYANLCEEQIEYIDGTTGQRYTCDGVFSTADTFETVINTICLCMGTAIMVDVDGWYGLIGGYDDTATTPVALGVNDVISSGVWNPAPPLSDSFNIVSGRFADPSQMWQLASWGSLEVDPLADGINRTNTVDFGCVDRAGACQRIAKQMVLREKYNGQFTAVFGPRGFEVSVGSLVSLTLPQFGFTAKLFRVIQQEESTDLLFNMVLREESAEIYEWDANEEKLLPAGILESTYDPIAAEAVEGLSVSARSVNGTNSVTTVFCDVSWTPPQSLRTVSIEIQARAAGQTNWTTEVERFFEVSLGTYPFAIGVNGLGVDVQARYRMSNGAYGDWATASLSSTPVSTVNQWSAITDDGTGTRPADGATNTADPNAPFGSGGQTVGGVINALNAASGGSFDTTAPDVPTGLAITTALAADGSVDVTFSWNANTETDLSGYDLWAANNGGNMVALALVAAPATSYIVHGLQPNQPISAELRAYDKSGNFSGFCAAVSTTTAKDTTPPAAPSSITATAGVDSALITVAAPPDRDVATIRVYLSAGTDFSSATPIGVVNALPSRTVSKLVQQTSGTVVNYWATAIDTSGNEGLPAGPVSTTTYQIGTSDIAARAVTAAQVATKTLTADNIQTQSLTGDLFQSATSLPATLTIGTTGFSLSTVQQAAATGVSAGNRVPMSDFSGGFTGFCTNDNNTGNPVTIGTGYYETKNYCNTTVTSTQAGQIFSIASDWGNTSYGYPYCFTVQAGETLCFQACVVVGNNLDPSLFRYSLFFLDANHSIISSVNHSNSAAVSGTSYTKLWGFASAPSNAVMGFFVCYVQSAASGSCTLTFAEPMVSTAAPGQTVPPAYVVGPTGRNAASVVNANSTTINPGNILISGGTTLASWRNGGDNTKIEGGAIAANTVAANKLTIGNRNLNFIELNFQCGVYFVPFLKWSGGYAQWTDANGNVAQVSIAAGQINPNDGGNYWYIYWTEGATTLSSTTNPGIANGAGAVCLCTWLSSQGSNFVANYGSTIIDGSRITSYSVTATQIAGQTITARQIASNTITGDRLAENTITATNIAAQQIDTSHLTVGGVDVSNLAEGAVGQASLTINEQRQTFTNTTFITVVSVALTPSQGRPVKGQFSALFTGINQTTDTRINIRVVRDDGTVIKYGTGGLFHNVSAYGTSIAFNFIDTVAAGRNTTWTIQAEKATTDGHTVAIDGTYLHVEETSRNTYQNISITAPSGTGPGVGSGGGGYGGGFAGHVVAF